MGRRPRPDEVAAVKESSLLTHVRSADMQWLKGSLCVTDEGRQELVAEVGCLEQIRKEIEYEIEVAPQERMRALLSELAAVEEQIARLKQILAFAQPAGPEGATVAIGNEVRIVDFWGERTVTIGGPLAANPRSECISYDSPLGQALLGRAQGDEVEIVGAVGCGSAKIVAIQPGRPGSGKRG